MDYSRFYFGIDLGTTNSVAACYDAAKGVCRTLVHQNGTPLVKSQLWRDFTGEVKVGAIPEDRFSNAEVIKDVKSSMMLNSEFSLGKDKYSAVEVSAEVLSTLKQIINLEYSEQVGHEIKEVTITVPAAFNNIQRSNTLKAAEKAGLSVISLINEPTAAALAYADKITRQETVMIYDLGGGTFDVSIVTISPKIPALRLPALGIDLPEQPRQMINVLRSDGNTRLGGNDLDRCMVEVAMQDKELQSLTQDVLKDAMHKAQRLKEHGGKGIEAAYVNEEVSLIFDEGVYTCATKEIFDKTSEIVKKLMSTVGSVEINRIVFVGGSTKNSYLREQLGEMFTGVPMFNDINPDECVAIGAAMNSFILSGQEGVMSFTDIVSSSLGILVKSDFNETFKKMLQKGEPLPAIKTIGLQKSDPSQQSISIPVYQGEQISYKQNHKIGELVISDIPSYVTVEDEIQCTLKVNKSGVLTVSAKLLGEEYRTEIDMSSVQVIEEEQDQMLSDLEDFITNEFE